jgi:hypothetical protein
MEQELHTPQEHLSSPPGFNGFRVALSLVFCITFVDRCLYFFACVVCPSSIYGF